MSKGPQAGLGLFAAKGSAGQAPDLSPLLARLSTDEQRITVLEKSMDGAVTTVSLAGNVLTFGHHDGAKHSVQLPGGTDVAGLRADIAAQESILKQQGIAIDQLKQSGQAYQHEIQSLSGTYSYTGDAPNYPADPKHMYIVNFANIDAREEDTSTPDLVLEDGTVLYYSNLDESAKVVLRPPTGYAINNADHFDLMPGNFIALVKDGKNFVKIASGMIPISSDDVVNRVAQALAGQLHTKDEIIAILNKWLANPTTQNTIKSIVASKEPHDQTQVYIGTGQDYPVDFTGAQGPLAPHQKLMAQGMDKTAAKVWIAVPYSVAGTVVGIAADGGLPAQWDSKRINVQGKYWTVFLSPYQLTSAHVDFTIDWRIK